MERPHGEDDIAVLNSSKPDEYEQTGAGLHQLLRRLNEATTREELQSIAAEAEQRSARPGLESTIETAYGVLASLARKRVAALTTGEGADGEEGA
jgi:hypothetical protein